MQAQYNMVLVYNIKIYTTDCWNIIQYTTYNTQYKHHQYNKVWTQVRKLMQTVTEKHQQLVQVAHSDRQPQMAHTWLRPPEETNNQMKQDASYKQAATDQRRAHNPITQNSMLAECIVTL